MTGLAALMLAEGAKGFFENSAVLIGIPLVVLGAIGAAIAVWVSGLPGMLLVRAEAGEEAHPGPEVYVRVGLVLAVVTLIEVAIYYVDLVQGALIASLLALSAIKFMLVVLWFMHLRFDSRIFTVLFSGGMMLAAAVFVVVLATLGANLV